MNKSDALTGIQLLQSCVQLWHSNVNSLIPVMACYLLLLKANSDFDDSTFKPLLVPVVSVLRMFLLAMKKEPGRPLTLKGAMPEPAAIMRTGEAASSGRRKLGVLSMLMRTVLEGCMRHRGAQVWYGRVQCAWQSTW